MSEQPTERTTVVTCGDIINAKVFDVWRRIVVRECAVTCDEAGCYECAKLLRQSIKQEDLGE